MHRGVCIAVTLALLLAHTAAQADDKQRCLSSYEQSQIERRDGHLTSSHDKLLICSQEQCPASIRKECIGWLREVEAALPSVVIRALGPEGADLTDVHVTCEGKRLADALDGRAVTIDPGPHTCRFESAGVAARVERIVVREGEQRRVWTIAFAQRETIAAERTSDADGPPNQEKSRPAVPVLVYALAGVALVGFAATAYFDLSTASQEHDLERCTPVCASSQVDDARRTQLLGKVSLGVGVVALVGAGIVFFTRPTAAVNAPARATSVRGVQLDVAPRSDGASAGIRALF